MVPVFVPDHHRTDLSVRCMRPSDEYRQITPNLEGGTRSNATLFDNRQRQQTNAVIWFPFKLRKLKLRIENMPNGNV